MTKCMQESRPAYLFFSIDKNKSNKSDELAASGKFLILVDDELEKKKRKKREKERAQRAKR